jgi:hypothetical protein
VFPAVPTERPLLTFRPLSMATVAEAVAAPIHLHANKRKKQFVH